jgi:hypothetical protein
MCRGDYFGPREFREKHGSVLTLPWSQGPHNLGTRGIIVYTDLIMKTLVLNKYICVPKKRKSFTATLLEIISFRN